MGKKERERELWRKRIGKEKDRREEMKWSALVKSSQKFDIHSNSSTAWVLAE